MKEQSESQVISRIGYVIALVMGGGMLHMVAFATDCTLTKCSQYQQIVIIIGAAMIVGGLLLGVIVLKSPTKPDNTSQRSLT